WPGLSSTSAGMTPRECFHIIGTRSSARRSNPLTGGALRLPDLDVFPQNARPGLSCENVAELIHGAELGAAARRGARIAALVENEISHPAVERVADPDALLESRIVHIVRL